jgi:hypothetical protein
LWEPTCSRVLTFGDKLLPSGDKPAPTADLIQKAIGAGTIKTLHCS